MADFSALDPFSVISAAERGLGRGFTNLSLPLPSYINRVYELQDDAGERWVVKFYRPGRWSIPAILEEHAFIHDCEQAEIPVVAPLVLSSGSTIAQWEEIPYALFPRRSGRDFDSDSLDAYFRLGGLLGRLHNCAAQAEAQHRLRLDPAVLTAGYVDELIDDGHVPSDFQQEFRAISGEIIQTIGPWFEDLEYLRCHGDCHRGNILDRPDEGLLLIDFDDMVSGPAVQDMWMLLPGRLADSRPELESLLEGYTAFRPFDRSQLQLIEALRAMRMIYYLAWCARQKSDYSFLQHHPQWGSDSFWRSEIADLSVQLDEIRESSS